MFGEAASWGKAAVRSAGSAGRKAPVKRRRNRAATTAEKPRRTGWPQPTPPSARWRSLRLAAAQDAHISDESLTDEQHAGHSNDRPGDKNRPHRQFRDF